MTDPGMPRWYGSQRAIRSGCEQATTAVQSFGPNVSRIVECILARYPPGHDLSWEERIGMLADPRKS